MSLAQLIANLAAAGRSLASGNPQVVSTRVLIRYGDGLRNVACVSTDTEGVLILEPGAKVTVDA